MKFITSLTTILCIIFLIYSINFYQNCLNIEDKIDKFQNTTTFLTAADGNSELIIYQEQFSQTPFEMTMFPLNSTESILIINKNRLRSIDTEYCLEKIKKLNSSLLTNYLVMKLTEHLIFAGNPLAIINNNGEIKIVNTNNCFLINDSIEQLNLIGEALLK